MQRYGSSTGNGAGCPIFLADSEANAQTDFVYSKNCSFSIVFLRPSTFSRRKFPFEKTNIYSWVSRKVGFDADCHEPHAVELLALAALSQMISPRMRKPRSTMSRA